MARPTLDQLWHKSRGGDERAKAQLARRVTAFVVPLAERVRWAMGGRPDVGDLINAGVLGLFEALERFDPERGVSFQIYCGLRVVGAMYDDQHKSDWVPHLVRSRARRLRALRDKELNATGRPPTDAELADALGLSVAEVSDLWHRAQNPAPIPLERAAPPDADTLDPAFVLERVDPARLFLAAEARALLHDGLRKLPERQRLVLILYYFENLTLAQIGEVLGLTESRACQIRKEALGKLLKRLGPRRDELLEALGE